MPTIKVIVLYFGWWIIWSVIQSLIIHQLGYEWTIAVTDAVTSNFLIAITGYAMGISLRFYQPEIKNALYLFTWSIGLAILCTTILYWLLLVIFKDESSYLHSLSATIYLRFAFAWLMLSFMILVSWLWFYIRDQREVESRNATAEKLAREAELTKLRQQLQPHFLFNCLNSISALVVVKPEQARKMIQQLSDFLRGTLKKDDQKLVPLVEELQHLQLYLDIEKVRFGHRLQTIIEKDEECMQMLTPALLLQPVVENAIKFGLYDTTGETIIRIKATVSGNTLVLITENPFDPTTAHPRKGTGFGLESVRRRLYLLFARQDLLSTQQHENIFITQIKIPQQV